MHRHTAVAVARQKPRKVILIKLVLVTSWCRSEYGIHTNDIYGQNNPVDQNKQTTYTSQNMTNLRCSTHSSGVEMKMI